MGFNMGPGIRLRSPRFVASTYRLSHLPSSSHLLLTNLSVISKTLLTIVKERNCDTVLLSIWHNLELPGIEASGHCFNWDGKTCPLWVVPFPGLDNLDCMRWRSELRASLVTLWLLSVGAMRAIPYILAAVASLPQWTVTWSLPQNKHILSCSHWGVLSQLQKKEQPVYVYN